MIRSFESHQSYSSRLLKVGNSLLKRLITYEDYHLENKMRKPLLFYGMFELCMRQVHV